MLLAYRVSTTQSRFDVRNLASVFKAPTPWLLAIPAMNDTHAGDKSPTDGSNGNEPRTDGGKNWERISRRKMSVMLQMNYDGEVNTAANGVMNAIEQGEEPTDAFWKMVSRFGEFSNAVHQDLVTLGDVHYETPKNRLFSTSRYVQDVFLNLGNAIENERVGDGIHADEFERARAALCQAHVLLHDLEEEYQGIGKGERGKWRAEDRFPTSEEHEKQLISIAKRGQKLAKYAGHDDQEDGDDE